MTFLPHQLDRDRAASFFVGQRGQSRRGILPDIWILKSPGEHHEIKHKNPTRGRYGYEDYRLYSLQMFQAKTAQPVYYTIHDWEVAKRESLKIHGSDDPQMPNILQDWRTVDLRQLVDYRLRHPERGERVQTWCNAEMRWTDGYYWPVSLWAPLETLWGLPG